MKRGGTSLTVKLVFRLVKVGMLGLPYANVEKITAHSNLLETLKICKWLLKQDHWISEKIARFFLANFFSYGYTITKDKSQEIFLGIIYLFP